jgi:hypothetical protein
MVKSILRNIKLIIIILNISIVNAQICPTDYANNEKYGMPRGYVFYNPPVCYHDDKYHVESDKLSFGTFQIGNWNNSCKCFEVGRDDFQNIVQGSYAHLENKDMPIEWYLNDNIANKEGLVYNAFLTWQNAAESSCDKKMLFASKASGIDNSNGNMNDRNEIYFGDTEEGYAGHADIYINVRECRIVEFDIVMSNKIDWNYTNEEIQGKYDFIGILIHEVGHAVGLAHPRAVNFECTFETEEISSMMLFYKYKNPWTLANRSLHALDKKAIKMLWNNCNDCPSKIINSCY